MTHSSIACSCLVALAACTDPAKQPAPPPPPPVLREITGAATYVSVDESGRASTFPIGLHDTLVSAQFPAGDGFDVREGISNADGTFSIAGAPDGDYWLDVYDVPSGSRQLLWTNATVLAFDEHALGRGDVVVGSPGTTLTFGPIDGLDPVQADDGLQLASGNLGLGFNLFGALTETATSLQSTRPWAGLPLVSAAKGDHLILTQLRQQQDPATGISYVSPIKSATLSSIEQVDGQDTAVTGAFTTPPSLDYDLRWNRSEFDAASAEIRPSSVGPAGSQTFLFRAMPGGTMFGTSPLAPIVLALDTSALTTTADLDVPFTLSNPYPASWLFNDFVMTYPVTLDVPGVPGSTVQLGVNIETNTNELPSASHPIRPLVSPPRSPTIGGLDLFGDHDGVGLTPSIAWQKPAVGEPTAYILTIERWELQVGDASLAPVASLVVPGDVTSVRMPARVLQPGEHYLMQIAAVTQQGQDVRVHSLYPMSIPYGFAAAITGTFSP